MATVSRNPDIKETYDHVLYGIPIALGQAINQGDLVCWDTTITTGGGTNGGLRVVAAQSDMAKYMGVSEQQSPFASLGDQFYSIGIRRGGIVRLHTTASETYKMFQEVYWNETADVQTITNGTNTGGRTVPVGYIIIPQALVMNGVTTVVGAAGVDVQVWLTPNYPVATI
jgi:hypothetical protein